MRVIYSIGVRFAGGGIGTIGHHAVRGLYRHRMLQRVLCGSYRPTEIPAKRIAAMGWRSRVVRRLAVYDRARRLDALHNYLYDAWAVGRLEACETLHAWGNFCLRSLRRAKALGAVTVVERASAHPLYQAKLLREEHARWGLPFHMRESSLTRALNEIEEADYVLIPSDFVRETFRAEGALEEKLIQIPFGVDASRFRPAAKPRAQTCFRVLFVGQLGIRKGLPYLLEAWNRLDWRDAELWLAGRLAPELKPILRRHDRLPVVRFLGQVAEPAALYKQADVFAFPTIEEGSALVTYEALASGLPVVTTYNAGSPVRDGREGFLVPVRDAEALAERLERLRTNVQLRSDMGRAARRRAEAFTWHEYGENLVRAISRVSPH